MRFVSRAAGSIDPRRRGDVSSPAEPALEVMGAGLLEEVAADFGDDVRAAFATAPIGRRAPRLSRPLIRVEDHLGRLPGIAPP